MTKRGAEDGRERRSRFAATVLTLNPGCCHPPRLLVYSSRVGEHEKTSLGHDFKMMFGDGRQAGG